MNKSLKISIITVCYNTAEYLEEAIKSVLSQDYDDFEKNIRQIIEICLYNLGVSMLRAKCGIFRIIKNLADSYSDFNSNDNIKLPFVKAFCRISINMMLTYFKNIIKKHAQ